jgi:hypothetical protein
LQFPQDVVLQLSIRVDLRDPWKKAFSTDFTDSADLQQQRQRPRGNDNSQTVRQLQFSKRVVLQLPIRVDLRDPWKKLFHGFHRFSGSATAKTKTLGERQQPNSRRSSSPRSLCSSLSAESVKSAGKDVAVSGSCRLQFSVEIRGK